MQEMCSIDFEDLGKGVVGVAIVFSPFKKRKGQFVAKVVAKASNPQGTRIISKSRIFEWKEAVYKDKTTEACLDELVAELLGDGWIPMDTGGATGWDWYKLKFRRPL